MPLTESLRKNLLRTSWRSTFRSEIVGALDQMPTISSGDRTPLMNAVNRGASKQIVPAETEGGKGP